MQFGFNLIFYTKIFILYRQHLQLISFLISSKKKKICWTIKIIIFKTKKMMSDVQKNFDIAINLSFQQNYFDDPTKLFLDLYNPTKF